MEVVFKGLPKTWEEMKVEMEDRLAHLRNGETDTIKIVIRSITVCTEIVQQLHIRMRDYQFLPGEEVQYYKEIKPYFLCRLIYYNRLYELEMARSTANLPQTEALLDRELERVTQVYERHKFIYRYLKCGATYLDEKLFFRPKGNDVVALYGMEIPAELGSPICYDHVVADLMAADLLRKYVEDAAFELRRIGNQAYGLPRIVWTDSKTALIELVYALHSAGAFNNGKVDLKDIFAYIEAVLHVDLGNYRRTFQEILSRKSGYVNALHRYEEKLLLRIEKIEDRHTG